MYAVFSNVLKTNESDQKIPQSQIRPTQGTHCPVIRIQTHQWIQFNPLMPGAICYILQKPKCIIYDILGIKKIKNKNWDIDFTFSDKHDI